MSDDLFEFAFWLFVLVTAIVSLAIVGTVCGAFTGWIVSLTPLGAAVKKVWFSLTGVECELWELGAFLGFISGFIKGAITVEKEASEG